MRMLIVVVVLLGATVTIAYSLRILMSSEQRAEPEALLRGTDGDRGAGRALAGMEGIGDPSGNIAERGVPDVMDAGDTLRLSFQSDDHRLPALASVTAADHDAGRAVFDEQIDVLRTSLQFVLRREQEESVQATRDAGMIQGALEAARTSGRNLAGRLEDGDRRLLVLTNALREKDDALEVERRRSADQRDRAAAIAGIERAASRSKIIMLTTGIGAATAEAADLKTKLAQSRASAGELQVRLARLEEVTDAQRRAAEDAALQLKAVSERASTFERLAGESRVHLDAEEKASSDAVKEQAELQAQLRSARSALNATVAELAAARSEKVKPNGIAAAAEGNLTDACGQRMTLLCKAFRLRWLGADRALEWRERAATERLAAELRSQNAVQLVSLGTASEAPPRDAQAVPAVRGGEPAGGMRSDGEAPSAPPALAELPRSAKAEPVSRGMVGHRPNIAAHPPLPDSVTGHILLLHYEHEGTRTRTRAQALLTALRSTGAEVQDDDETAARKAGDTVTYFYTQDRGLADRVAQDLDGAVPVRSRGSNGRPPRPGTIEVSIGD